MSTNQIIDNGSGLAAESWKNLKCYSIDVNNTTINENLVVSGDADIVGDVSISGDITQVGYVQANNYISSNASFIVNNGTPLERYVEATVNDLDCVAINGGSTTLDVAYIISYVTIGKIVTLKLDKNLSNTVAGATSIQISDLPSSILPSFNCIVPIVLNVSGADEVCIATVDTSGVLSIKRASGNFGVGDGLSTHRPFINYAIY